MLEKKTWMGQSPKNHVLANKKHLLKDRKWPISHFWTLTDIAQPINSDRTITQLGSQLLKT